MCHMRGGRCVGDVILGGGWEGTGAVDGRLGALLVVGGVDGGPGAGCWWWGWVGGWELLGYVTPPPSTQPIDTHPHTYQPTPTKHHPCQSTTTPGTPPKPPTPLPYTVILCGGHPNGHPMKCAVFLLVRKGVRKGGLSHERVRKGVRKGAFRKPFRTLSAKGPPFAPLPSIFHATLHRMHTTQYGIPNSSHWCDIRPIRCQKAPFHENKEFGGNLHTIGVLWGQ